MAGVLRISFLGADGSLSEDAARIHAERDGRTAELAGATEPGEVLARLAGGACERAVLPVANSSAGLVWPTLAALGARALELVDEVVLPVRLSLFAARPGTALSGIERVASHPHALQQCARSLERLLPGRARLSWSDTASAARDLASGVLDARTAVVASTRAGARYGLALLAADVHDEPDNRTYFAVLACARGAATE